MNFAKLAFKRLTPYFVFFIALELIVRLALILYSWEDFKNSLLELPAAFLTGAAYDLVAFAYIAIPLLFYFLCVPTRFQGQKPDRIISTVLFFIFVYVLIFSAVGEWFFWDEFQSRYNFIAVDYLVYTTEVIGNIRESYPETEILAAMCLICGGLAYAYYKVAPKYLPQNSNFRKRASSFLALILVCVVSFNITSPDYAEISKSRPVNEIARNGIYELFSAYVNNELDFANFYQTLPEEEVKKFIQAELGSSEVNGSPLERKINNKQQKKHNLIVITVESLSARFLKEFGSEDNVTPNLDKLIDQSLFFSNLYATGTRTVYGLSAITLSMPPVPGNSIVRRPDNGNLYSLGHVLQTQKYETKFIYGGFGYFDNMNKFFAENGYKIIDRSNLKKDEINFANVWGVADDDLYRRVLKESDASYAAEKPFFNMVMTTSNHRPFTYPDGKIDIPSPGKRQGGVKFTDYAIGYFLEEARKKPWFKDTIFVIVADHTASSAGKTELEPAKYRIPMWIYAPGIVKPGRVDWMASQIDVAPTILGLMGVDYTSRFYGKDLMKEKPERIFISNYQKLGYMTKEGLVILEPVDQYNFYQLDEKGFKQHADAAVPQDLLDATIGYYQSASYWREWSRHE
ncbi:MAG: sulfatase [Micavibrio aeruginosavorus]|uniref:Sulfatase n=1 Tax=Micavibrio aeruginosavorus TaxID=349221 RepID=A0A2W5HAF3_9BACT|nr:MAG: sulfatase [Micavibrio aeruginosavorus]